MPANPVVNTSYDVRNPPVLDTLATTAYHGPAFCGKPTLSFYADGQKISFLSYDYDSNTNLIKIKLADSK